jgi:anti-sigma factor RsiW
MAAVSTEMTARSVTMTVSELELHAYIDGQLLEEERARIAAAVIASQPLAEEVSVLHELKQLIRFVYGSDRLPRTNVLS